MEAAVHVQDLAADPRATGRRAGSRPRRPPARRRPGPSRAAPGRPRSRRAGRSPGCRPAAGVDDRAGGHQVHADARAAEVARQVAANGLERRLGHPHPVVDRPGHRGVEGRGPPGSPPSGISGASADASALNEKALVRKASAADSGGVSRKSPPSASRGREGDRVERAVDRAPARLELAGSAAKSLGVFTSSSSTSGGSGSCAAARSVSRRARPKLVSTTSAPVLLRPLGHGEGDAAAGQHAGDHEALARRAGRALTAPRCRAPRCARRSRSVRHRPPPGRRRSPAAVPPGT